MRPEDLLDALRRQPFKPFRLYLTDGTVYEIRHPDLIWVARSRAVILAIDPNYPHFKYERYDTVALLHIVKLVPMPPSPGSN